MNEQWGMDLADIQKYRGANNRKRYLLCVMDIFSKKAWVEPIPNKTGGVVVKALQRIFKRAGCIPQRIQSDAGSEFLNKQVKNYLKDLNINLFTVSSELKCCTIERFIRTFMGKVSRYMTHNNTKRFVDKILDFENLYNNSYHRSIKMCPSQVSVENEKQVFENLYGNDTSPLYRRPKFQVGDNVLVTKRNLGKLEKGYMTGYLKDRFVITEIRGTVPTTYKLSTLDDTPVKGSFYDQQLQKIDHL